MPGFCVASHSDRTEKTVGSRGVATVGPGASRDVGAADDGELWVAVDDDSVVANASSGCGQSGAQAGSDAGDVVDDDALLAVGPTDDLEPERSLRPLLEAAHDVLDGLVERQPFDDLGDVVDLEAQAPSDQSVVAAQTIVGIDGSQPTSGSRPWRPRSRS